MAVAPTGAIYKALEFDGVSSRTYGVYITGEAVYNAPERDVEMITIPGRSGSFALDNGRFENITVTYPAGIFAETEADFREAISDFRNFLCSRKGYVRLKDEYNPNEYRMAVYKSGLEVEPAMLKAGEFEITFDCKPQRWLTSGETAVSVTSGDTITNPTLFESSPLLEITGYGDIGFNGYEISIVDSSPWTIRLLRHSSKNALKVDYFGSSDLVNDGDPETFEWVSVRAEFASSKELASASITSTTGYAQNEASVSVDGTTGRLDLKLENVGFLTATETKSCTVNIQFTATDTTTATLSLTLAVQYGRKNLLPTKDLVEIAVTQTASGFVSKANANTTVLSWADLMAQSSVSILNYPTFIDCDLGACYSKIASEIIPLNAYIDLGSKLPTLASGSNTITFDNTITDLKVTPRWWKV